MGAIGKFKIDEKVVEKKEEKKRAPKLLNSDELEIKLLDAESLEDAVKVLKKCTFEVTPEEVKSIIDYGMSYGTFVDRMLVGVGLAWPAPFDEQTNSLAGQSNNAIYNEAPAVLLAYEGRGLRSILLKKREEEGKNRNFAYSIAYVDEDPRTEVSGFIKEAGNQLEKLYLREGYEFHKTKKGIIAVKKLI
jgi:hypothetical protein